MSYLNKVVNIYEAKGAKDPKDLFADLKAKPVNTDGAGTRDKPMKNDNPLPDAQHNNPRAAKQAKKDVKTPRTQQKDSNDPNVKPASLKNDHTEYKRMGAMMAEALGYRVDEIAPIAAAAGRLAMGAAKKKAVGMVADRMKRREQEKEQKPGMQVAWTVYKQIGMAISEAAREAYIDKESQAEVADKKADGGFAGPMARGVSKPGGKGVAGAATKDRFVKSSLRRGGEAIRKAAKEKLGVDANPDKIATKNLAQVGKQLNKKRATARGEGVPAETPDIKKAAIAADKEKMAGPPEGR